MATHTYTIVLAVPDVYVTADFTAETTKLGQEALRLTRNQNQSPHQSTAHVASEDPPTTIWEENVPVLTTCTGVVT